MAVAGIGRSAWQYENIYETAKGKSAAQTEKATDASGTKRTGAQEYFGELGAKYGVNVTLGSDKGFDSYMLGASGSNNIYIDKTVAEKAMSDPKLAAALEEKIKNVPQAGKEIVEGCEKLGSEVLACGTQIDKNGRVSYWSVGRASRETLAKREAEGKQRDAEKARFKEQIEARRKERKEQAKKLEEKREEKRAEEKKAQEKRAEDSVLTVTKKDSTEELLDAVRTGNGKEVDVQNTAGARLDLSI